MRQAPTSPSRPHELTARSAPSLQLSKCVMASLPYELWVLVFHEASNGGEKVLTTLSSTCRLFHSIYKDHEKSLLSTSYLSKIIDSPTKCTTLTLALMPVRQPEGRPDSWDNFFEVVPPVAPIYRRLETDGDILLNDRRVVNILVLKRAIRLANRQISMTNSLTYTHSHRKFGPPHRAINIIRAFYYYIGTQWKYLNNRKGLHTWFEFYKRSLLVSFPAEVYDLEDGVQRPNNRIVEHGRDLKAKMYWTRVLPLYMHESAIWSGLDRHSWYQNELGKTCKYGDGEDGIAYDAAHRRFYKVGEKFGGYQWRSRAPPPT